MRSRTRARAAWTSWRVTIQWEIPPGRPRGKSAHPPAAGTGSCAGSVLDEAAGQLDAVPHAELVEDRLQVALHRLRSDPEPLGDLARAEPVGDEQRDLAFTMGEAVRRRRDAGRLGAELDRLGHRLAPEVQLGLALADRGDVDAEALAGPLHHEGPANAGRPGLCAVREPAKLRGHLGAVGRVGEEDLQHLLRLAVATQQTVGVAMRCGAPGRWDANVCAHHLCTPVVDRLPHTTTPRSTGQPHSGSTPAFLGVGRDSTLSPWRAARQGERWSALPEYRAPPTRESPRDA